ncbi:MAG TPA: hypothetical protein VKB18_08085 [Gemmatimonadota bacterium]|nr:hypothetical protein [Gemmatimonadota bacterium]
MRARSGGWVLGLGALVALAAPAAAQQAHAVSPEQVTRTVDGATTRSQADRAALEELLARPQTEAVANRYGLDLQRAREAAATLDGRELARLGSRARQLNEALAGGADMIVISSTTLIIALLVLIIILVA